MIKKKEEEWKEWLQCSLEEGQKLIKRHLPKEDLEESLKGLEDKLVEQEQLLIEQIEHNQQHVQQQLLNLHSTLQPQPPPSTHHQHPLCSSLFNKYSRKVK